MTECRISRSPEHIISLLLRVQGTEVKLHIVIRSFMTDHSSCTVSAPQKIQKSVKEMRHRRSSMIACDWTVRKEVGRSFYVASLESPFRKETNSVRGIFTGNVFRLDL